MEGIFYQKILKAFTMLEKFHSKPLTKPHIFFIASAYPIKFKSLSAKSFVSMDFVIALNGQISLNLEQKYQQDLKRKTLGYERIDMFVL